jgi:hypothetical protein
MTRNISSRLSLIHEKLIRAGSKQILNLASTRENNILSFTDGDNDEADFFLIF